MSKKIKDAWSKACESKELSPCPFCGSKCISIMLTISTPTEYTVHCPTSGCYIRKAPSLFFKDRKAVIAAWNKRDTTDRDALLAACEKAYLHLAPLVDGSDDEQIKAANVLGQIMLDFNVGQAKKE